MLLHTDRCSSLNRSIIESVCHCQFANLGKSQNVSAEPGKIYYFRAHTRGTGTKSADLSIRGQLPTLDLDLLNSDEGQYMVASSAFSESHAKK
jgi:hypothetical protein